MNELLLKDLLSPAPPPLVLSTPSSTIPRPCLSRTYCVSARFSVLGTHGVGRGEDQTLCPSGDHTPVGRTDSIQYTG